MLLDRNDNISKLISILTDYVPNGYTIRNKKVVGDITYLGFSTPGTPSDSINWFIKKINDTTGVEDFIRISHSGTWDNVELLNYI
jgi:hypothetical protein